MLITTIIIITIIMRFAQTALLHDPPSQPLASPRLHFCAALQTADAVAPPPSTTPASNRCCQAVKHWLDRDEDRGSLPVSLVTF
ncbi:hypothetical protein PanWU01x14_204650 [Parasponia andersonii]|uniref:Secreted protein n=1 Tax=Parasponia andersonii TaxID=3476 RepID=A0A2P5BWA7_PARAD|nr:hypothetical protein PanWU01x14_204650 [Parasponia andersonii]